MLSAMDGQESRKRLATELRQKQKNKQKNLPRINTEFHGNKNKQKQKISDGKKTLLSEPDA
jgi:hypothetical protein